MAEQQQPSLGPQRAQLDEKALPVPRAQGLPQRGRRLQQGPVFIEHRERVTQRAAHGPDFYDLPRNTGTITLRRESWTPPESFVFGEANLKPLRAGEALPWRLV